MRKQVSYIIFAAMAITLTVMIFILINLFDRGKVVFTDINKPVGPIVTANDPFMGSTSPDLRLVLFSNFTCPTCEEFSNTVRKVVPDYNVTLIWKSLPNNTLNPESTRASEAAMCAGEQNLFWQYHNLLMSQKGVLNDNVYTELAIRSGIRLPKFSRCLERGKYRQPINDAIEEAGRLGVTASPTLYVGNDRFATGTISEADLRRRIELILGNGN
jgi:protein-disulfide isomerase